MVQTRAAFYSGRVSDVMSKTLEQRLSSNHANRYKIVYLEEQSNTLAVILVKRTPNLRKGVRKSVHSNRPSMPVC